MNFKIELREDSRSSEHQLSFQISPNGQGSNETLPFTIDGEPLQADWAEVSPGTYSILIDGQSYQARVAPASGNDPAQPDDYVVTIAEYDFHVQIRDPRARRFAGQSVQLHGPLDVLAPMPGKVVRVLVSPDQEVHQDEGLVVIEAMKMQNELRAPRAGHVTAVHVQEGIGIEAGAKLLRLE